MPKFSSALSARELPSVLSVPHAARTPTPIKRPRSDPGPRTLHGSSHAVCLGANGNGGTTICGEWELAFSRGTDRIEAGARVLVQERIRFRTDAAHLRRLAHAMLAGARELDAIEAHMALDDGVRRIDPDYLETITLTGDGVGPSFESPLYVEPFA